MVTVHLRILLVLVILLDGLLAYPQEENSDDAVDVGQDQATTVAQKADCNVVGLIKCFANILDDWMLHMYYFRENIVTLNKSSCEHQETMKHCVTFTDCSRTEILSASKTMTDLILHRQNSGTFLKSYYFTQFACSEEGQKIVETHRACLVRNRLSQVTFEVSHYIEQQFLTLMATPPPIPNAEPPSLPTIKPDYCGLLTDKAHQVFTVAKEECTLQPAFLMCKSMADTFFNLFPEQLTDCDVPCAKNPETTPKPDAQNGAETTLGSSCSDRYKNAYQLLFLLIIASFISSAALD